MPDVTPKKTRYFIESGAASWHQRHAGHFYTTSAIMNLTPEELEHHRTLEEGRSGRFLAIPWDRLPE